MYRMMKMALMKRDAKGNEQVDVDKLLRVIKEASQKNQAVWIHDGKMYVTVMARIKEGGFENALRSWNTDEIIEYR